jgi:hypothetical protein
MDKLVRAVRVVMDYSTSDEEQSLVRGYTVYVPASTNTGDKNITHLEQRPVTAEEITVMAVKQLDSKHQENYDETESSEWSNETVIVPLSSKGHVIINSFTGCIPNVSEDPTTPHWRRCYTVGILPFEIKEYKLRDTLRQFNAMCQHFGVRWESIWVKAKDDNAHSLLTTDKDTISNLVTMVDKVISAARSN